MGPIGRRPRRDNARSICAPLRSQAGGTGRGLIMPTRSAKRRQFDHHLGLHPVIAADPGRRRVICQPSNAAYKAIAQNGLALRLLFLPLDALQRPSADAELDRDLVDAVVTLPQRPADRGLDLPDRSWRGWETGN
jgi:hypothetical protein